MPFLEKYVTTLGGGFHNGTSVANAWNIVEMFAAVIAPNTRVNIKESHSFVGAGAFQPGTAPTPIVYRGYNAVPGDLDGVRRGQDGLLDISKFPSITFDTPITTSPNVYLQNLYIKSSSATVVFDDAGLTGSFGVINCRVENDFDDGGALTAGLIFCGIHLLLINSDLICSGINHGRIISCGLNCRCVGCYIHGAYPLSGMLMMESGQAYKTAFVGPGLFGVTFLSDIGQYQGTVIGCTMYRLDYAILLPNAIQNLDQFVCLDNHVTDCGFYLLGDPLVTSVIELNNRTRDNLNPRVDVLSTVLGAEIATDNGGRETDYVSNTNLRLIDIAAGRKGGMMPDSDCGAYQTRTISAGGSRPPGRGSRPIFEH